MGELPRKWEPRYERGGNPRKAGQGAIFPLKLPDNSSEDDKKKLENRVTFEMVKGMKAKIGGQGLPRQKKKNIKKNLKKSPKLLLGF